jgi:hypothetical protein
VKRMALGAVAAAAVMLLASPAAAQYPDVADIAVSDTTLACPGEDFTISGEGFLPGETVTIFFDGEEVASVTAGDDGTFTVTITVPDAAAGSHTVTAVGEESGGDASATVTCVAGAAVAFTGANISVGLILVAALIAVGAVALYAGRRRSRSAA